MKHEHSPFKRRFSEWTNPKIIAVAIILQFIGLPMVLWLMTYKSDAAVVMFVITWWSLTAFVVYMVRRAELDPRHYVDNRVLDRTKQEIKDHRIAVRKELVANEMAALRKGEKTPVLDVWRLDPKLSARHPFFSEALAVVIDPRQREFLVRVQREAMPESDDERKTLCDRMLGDTVSYVQILSRDAYLHLLRSFFDRVILEVDSMREDEHHVDVPFPILSLCLEARKFWQFASLPVIDTKVLVNAAEIRFSEGGEIEPHRSIDVAAARGLK